ncbi:hypothetical protein A167_00024 [Alcanivorax sp. S71-1-4]|uniref:hypothetical protein n=1 Tax=Alcanivorax sp. S71-1-4 TaxID=1177159 RepID=UPI00135A63EF|nr:hypothetical protein [Alcanivorax sp. S71-1-4]KAF0810992.1 hypothetical protein A167_00024 [Alcanivorax sp. S71-1-4]
MNQAVTLLLMHLPGVSATAKYFLVRALYLGHEVAGGMSLDELSSQFGLTKRAVIRVRDELMQPVKKYGDGYLLEKKCPSGSGHGGRGRPRKYFQFNPDFLEDLCPDGTKQGVAHAEICQFLMQSHVQFCKARLRDMTGRAVADGPKDRPSALNLYVLALLWALADEMGAIWERGVGEIAQMAGMTRDQANNHLSKLTRMGYIDSRLSGVSGSSLFGRSPGAIFLNPAHSALSGVWGDVEWYWDTYPTQDSILWAVEDASREANVIGSREKKIQAKGPPAEWVMRNLYLDKRAFEGGLLFYDAWRELTESGRILGVYSVFQDAAWPVRRYAKAVLCRYARQILERQVQAICQSREVLDPEVLDDIQRLIATKCDREEKRTKGVALWFYSRAYVLAQEIFRQRALALIPAEKDAGSLSFLEKTKQARAALAESGEAWSFFPNRMSAFTKILIRMKRLPVAN